MSEDSGSDYSSSDSYSEPSSGGSLMAALFGMVVVVGSVIGLFWNEGRAVTTARSLTEGAGLVIRADAARVDASNAGKLIHVAGNAQTSQPLRDADFDTSISALKLVRVVEMYQWKETRNKEKDTTTYSYSKVWAEGRINSNEFRRSSGHHNPDPLYKRRQVVAQDAQLGSYQPGSAVLTKLKAGEKLAMPAAALDQVRSRSRRDVHLIDDVLYVGADPSAPQVGDLRITMRVARTGPISIIGAQAGSDFTQYQTKAGDKLLMVTSGIASAEQMFADAHRENTLLTWLIRFFGVFFMWLGGVMIMRPITALLEDVPVIGSIVSAGAALIALVCTMIAAPLTIAVAWFYYRPLLSVFLVVGGFALAYLMRGPLLSKAQANRPAEPQPTVDPVRSFLPASGAGKTFGRAPSSFLPRDRVGLR